MAQIKRRVHTINQLRAAVARCELQLLKEPDDRGATLPGVPPLSLQEGSALLVEDNSRALLRDHQAGCGLGSNRLSDLELVEVIEHRECGVALQHLSGDAEGW